MNQRLSGARRVTLVRFLTNAGTIALGGLVVGPFVSQHGFRPRMFVMGAVLYLAVLGGALWLSQDEKGEA